MGSLLEFYPDSLDKTGHFLVETLNKFVSQLPEKESKVGQRLAIQILEVADLASQETISAAAGLAQSRSLRHYKKRLREEGLAALFNRPRTGRPSITNQPLLQKTLSDIIWQALLTERILPDDSTLSARLRDALQSDSFDHTKITPGIVKTIRLRLGFIDTKIQLLFSTSTISSAQPQHTKLLPLSDQTPTSPNDTIIPTVAQPVGQQTASVASDQIPTVTSTAKHQQTASIEAPDQAQALAISASDQQQISAIHELYNAHRLNSTAPYNLHISSGLASDNGFTPNNTKMSSVNAPNPPNSCAQHNADLTHFDALNNVQGAASCRPNNPVSVAPDNAIIRTSLPSNQAIIATLAVSDHLQLPVSSANHQAQANLAGVAPTLASLTATEKGLKPSASEGSVLPIPDPCQEQQKGTNAESSVPSTCAVGKRFESVSPQSSESRPTHSPATQKRYVAKSAAKQAKSATEIGITSVGGAFILLALLVQTSWLACAKVLPIASNYAVTTTQWLLTALFSVIFGIRRAFHLDDCLDIGFALVTGRARPLSHSTFGHLLHSFDEKSIDQFYNATAQEEVEQLKNGTHRVSVDGHNLARYTKIADLQKGKIGNSGRILPAEEMVLAFDLDEDSWLAMRTYHGTNKLSTALLDIIQELRQNKPHDEFRIFIDKGAYHGKSFQKLKETKNVHFYTPAKRTNPNVKQWEAISDDEYTSFVFDKHMKLAEDKRPTYRMADTKMQINVYEDKKKVGTVCLRALVVNNPDGEKPAEVWPFVLLTDDQKSDAKKLLNEYGDHWAQEIGHRVGRHDLFLDVLPTGYKIKSKRNQSGEIEREVDFDQSAFRLSAWLRLLVYNLMARFASQLPANYQKMWAGTLLRKFIRRQASIYLLDEELLIVFDPFPDHEVLHPLMVELNAKRIPVPWLNNLVLQFAIANKPMYPLKDTQIRKRLFSRH